MEIVNLLYATANLLKLNFGIQSKCIVIAVIVAGVLLLLLLQLLLLLLLLLLPIDLHCKNALIETMGRKSMESLVVNCFIATHCVSVRKCVRLPNQTYFIEFILTKQKNSRISNEKKNEIFVYKHQMLNRCSCHSFQCMCVCVSEMCACVTAILQLQTIHCDWFAVWSIKSSVSILEFN